MRMRKMRNAECGMRNAENGGRALKLWREFETTGPCFVLIDFLFTPRHIKLLAVRRLGDAV